MCDAQRTPGLQIMSPLTKWPRSLTPKNMLAQEDLKMHGSCCSDCHSQNAQVCRSRKQKKEAQKPNPWTIQGECLAQLCRKWLGNKGHLPKWLVVSSQLLTSCYCSSHAEPATNPVLQPPKAVNRRPQLPTALQLHAYCSLNSSGMEEPVAPASSAPDM